MYKGICTQKVRIVGKVQRLHLVLSVVNLLHNHFVFRIILYIISLREN